MADWLLVSLVVLGAGVVAWILVGAIARRRTFAGDMDTPMRLEHARAKSEAEMAAPVSEAEEEEAAPLVAFVEEIGTDDAFNADPLGAPIPEGHQRAEAAEFKSITEEWFAAFAWPASPAPTVSISSVQISEPDPYDLEGPTGVFPKDWIDRMVAEAKAGAK